MTMKYAVMISTIVPSSRIAGRYTNAKGTMKAVMAKENAFQPVFHALAPAMPAAVKDARQTGGVI